METKKTYARYYLKMNANAIELSRSFTIDGCKALAALAEQIEAKKAETRQYVQGFNHASVPAMRAVAKENMIRSKGESEELEAKYKKDTQELYDRVKTFENYYYETINNQTIPDGDYYEESKTVVEMLNSGIEVNDRVLSKVLETALGEKKIAIDNPCVRSAVRAAADKIGLFYDFELWDNEKGLRAYGDAFYEQIYTAIYSPTGYAMMWLQDDQAYIDMMNHVECNCRYEYDKALGKV